MTPEPIRTVTDAQRTISPRFDWDAELRKHTPWLRAVVAARIRERDAVEEVLQEVALAAVGNRAPPRDSAKLGPWFYQLAVRQSLLYRRSLGRRRKLANGYAQHGFDVAVEQVTVDPLEWLLKEEQQALVREAIDRLHRRDREILLLKYTQDWSYRQLAAHLGISHSAVEARLHRARSRLRGELARLNLVERETTK